MPYQETMFEILDENGTTIGNVDLKAMRTEIDNYIRVMEHLKQEMQQLRNLMQRSQSQIKMLEVKVSRR
jgi:predicted RNase H-like nuclease (RuvC/YqgF family)